MASSLSFMARIATAHTSCECKLQYERLAVRRDWRDECVVNVCFVCNFILDRSCCVWRARALAMTTIANESEENRIFPSLVGSREPRDFLIQFSTFNFRILSHNLWFDFEVIFSACAEAENKLCATTQSHTTDIDRVGYGSVPTLFELGMCEQRMCVCMNGEHTPNTLNTVHVPNVFASLQYYFVRA